MTKSKLKIQKAPKAYNLDPEKLKGASQSILPYLFGSNLYYTEDYEYFDKIRPYLNIPESPKSIEELSQELEEKIDVLMARTITKFEYSKESAERKYKYEFDRIINNFQYAVRNGNFPKITLYGVDGSLLVSQGNGLSWVEPNVGAKFEVKPDKNSVGYWDVPPNMKIWLKKKPNPIVRYFSKLLLNFTWKDK